jgi:pimeloyl-ACP methyl ester carboxylesterase
MHGFARSLRRRLLRAIAALFAANGPAVAEPVQISHEGHRLNADLSVPSGGDLREGLVLLVHGTLMHGRMEIMAALQRDLAVRRVASLAITLSLGVDDRRGPRDCATPHRHTVSQSAQEIGAWTRWAQERGITRIDLAGHSRGGAHAAWTVASGGAPGVRRLILIAPTVFEPNAVAAAYQAMFGMPLATRLAEASAAPAGEVLGPFGFLTCREARVAAGAFLDAYTEPERHDTPTILARTHVPTLLVIAGSDQIVRGLERRVPYSSDRVRVVTIDGADHFFRDLHGEDLADAVASFVRE